MNMPEKTNSWIPNLSMLKAHRDFSSCKSSPTFKTLQVNREQHIEIRWLFLGGYFSFQTLLSDLKQEFCITEDKIWGHFARNCSLPKLKKARLWLSDSCIYFALYKCNLGIESKTLHIQKIIHSFRYQLKIKICTICSQQHSRTTCMGYVQLV